MEEEIEYYEGQRDVQLELWKEKIHHKPKTRLANLYCGNCGYSNTFVVNENYRESNYGIVCQECPDPYKPMIFVEWV